jgi:hypothetical protein
MKFLRLQFIIVPPFIVLVPQTRFAAWTKVEGVLKIDASFTSQAPMRWQEEKFMSIKNQLFQNVKKNMSHFVFLKTLKKAKKKE